MHDYFELTVHFGGFIVTVKETFAFTFQPRGGGCAAYLPLPEDLWLTTHSSFSWFRVMRDFQMCFSVDESNFHHTNHLCRYFPLSIWENIFLLKGCFIVYSFSKLICCVYCQAERNIRFYFIAVENTFGFRTVSWNVYFCSVYAYKKWAPIGEYYQSLFDSRTCVFSGLLSSNSKQKVSQFLQLHIFYHQYLYKHHLDIKSQMYKAANVCLSVP